MNKQEFDKTAYGHGDKAQYKGVEHFIKTIDFETRKFGLVHDPTDEDAQVLEVKCDNVKFIPFSKPVESQIYTIERLKSEKIAVRCENAEQAGDIDSSIGLVGFTCFPIIVFWNRNLYRWDWHLKEKTTTHYGAIIPFSQVQFNDEKPEKDWEVTAITNAMGDLIKYKDGVCIWRSDKEVSVKGTMDLSEALKYVHKIHTVLRKTDNSEWSLEENARSVNNELPKPIESFRIDGNNMLVKLVGKSAEYNINNLSKPAKPFFVTEDGEGVFEVDEIIQCVYKSDFALREYKPFQIWESEMKVDHLLIFKHRENALAYIRDNKPEYSRKQIKGMMDELASDGVIWYHELKEKLGLTDNKKQEA